MGEVRRESGPVLCVVGARPNYMKMAPVLRALTAQADLPRPLLVHTGQHYDPTMNGHLFRDLQLPPPEVNLEVGSGSHALQTAEIMRRFEPVVERYGPCCVVVVGDVNSTLACSLVAVKKGIPVAHVEAGLRSFDRDMPEEINRVLTDQISELLFTTERSAADNLAREGIGPERIRFVGNVMIDCLLAHLPRAVPPEETLERAGAGTGVLAGGGRFGLVTLHRPSNVDHPDALAQALDLLAEVSARLPLIWPVHPRTEGNMARFGLTQRLAAGNVVRLPPQGYLETVGLMARAQAVFTDSGGIQEETTALGVPCLTLRENTERPITVEQGTNTVVGRNRALVRSLMEDILNGRGKVARRPELWDGHAAERIARELAGWLARRPLPAGV